MRIFTGSLGYGGRVSSFVQAPPRTVLVIFRGDEGCGVLDGEGKRFPPDWPNNVLTCGTEVATYSKNGNATVRVQVSGVPNPTGRTVHPS